MNNIHKRLHKITIARNQLPFFPKDEVDRLEKTEKNGEIAKGIKVIFGFKDFSTKEWKKYFSPEDWKEIYKCYKESDCPNEFLFCYYKK